MTKEKSWYSPIYAKRFVLKC